LNTSDLLVTCSAVLADEYMVLHTWQFMWPFASVCRYCRVHIYGGSIQLRGPLYSHISIYLNFEVYMEFITIYGNIFGYIQRALLLMLDINEHHHLFRLSYASQRINHCLPQDIIILSSSTWVKAKLLTHRLQNMKQRLNRDVRHQKNKRKIVDDEESNKRTNESTGESQKKNVESGRFNLEQEVMLRTLNFSFLLCSYQLSYGLWTILPTHT